MKTDGKGAHKVNLQIKAFLFEFILQISSFPVIAVKRNLFIWAYEPSKKIVKRISFNDLTLLHDVDSKRSLLIWKLFLLCISHLKNENTSCRIFCLLAKWNKVRLNLFDKYWNKKIFSWNSICLLQCSSG